MLRRILSAVPIAVIGVLALSGIAAGYPPPAAVPGGITGDSIFLLNGSPAVAAGESFAFSGTGFLSGEGISIDLSFIGASGLRRTPSLVHLSNPMHFDLKASPEGSFTQSITWDAVGVLTMTAVGQTSGHTITASIAVVGPSALPGAGAISRTDGISGNNGSASNASSSDVSYGGDGDRSGLAFTGASVAGPIAVGLVALFAGLALLFFGTRGVRRRKNAQGR